EGLRASVGRSESVTGGRKTGLAVAAAKRHGTGVTGGRVAKGVLGRKAEAACRASGGRGRVARHHQAAGDGRRYHNAGWADAEAVAGVGGREQLGPGRFHGAVESTRTGVTGSKGVVGGREGCLAITAAERNRTCVAGGNVREGISGGDGEGACHT